MKKLLLLAALLALVFANQASAETYDVNVRAGKSTVIGGFVLTAGRSCVSMKPGKAKIRTAPKNGTVRLVRDTWRPKTGSCKGLPLSAWKFVYRGNGKSDYVVITITADRYADSTGYKTWFRKYKINQ